MLTLEQIRQSTRATVTIKDAAFILGVDPRTVSAALSIHGGDIPARSIGRRVVIPRDAFLAWFDGPESASSTSDTVPATEPSAVDSTTRLIRGKLVELLAALEEA